jgi:hypothetical protein
VLRLVELTEHLQVLEGALAQIVHLFLLAPVILGASHPVFVVLGHLEHINRRQGLDWRQVHKRVTLLKLLLEAAKVHVSGLVYYVLHRTNFDRRHTLKEQSVPSDSAHCFFVVHLRVRLTPFLRNDSAVVAGRL